MVEEVVLNDSNKKIILNNSNNNDFVILPQKTNDFENIIKSEKDVVNFGDEDSVKPNVVDDSIEINADGKSIDTENINLDVDVLENSGAQSSDTGRTLINPFERVPTGINGFDELIEGGFEKNSIVLLVGSAGTGKTLLSLQFLYEGAKQFDETGVFISFEESKESIYRHSLQFGWDFAKLEEKKKFKFLYFKPHHVVKILEEGGGQIRDALSEINAKRIVIDSITAYGLLFKDEYKRREKILEFFNLLGKWGITSIIIAENSPAIVEGQEGSIAFISDAVISLYYHHDEEKGIRIHSLEILKMRGTKHTNKLCAINFEDDGITVYPDVEVF
ncbi:MAG: ATPase domain-containing protein [Candidatus ainarchaeum sp.]|nr:ATPase domain-containing protein [Candidatus ainarchaeum sp.]